MRKFRPSPDGAPDGLRAADTGLATGDAGGFAAAQAGPPKYRFLHMLRGFAALWVVLFHIHAFGVTSGYAANWPGLAYNLAFTWGRGGVAVFFVLSGFVIAHALENKSIDGRGFAEFFARRSLRLDPPYFVSIAFTLAVAGLIASANGNSAWTVSGTTIAAHLFYLQELLRTPSISVIYWTLTYEIQFYLVYAFTVGLAQYLAARGHRMLARAVDWAMLALALAGAALGTEWSLYGLFTNYWFAFYMGVLAKRACRDRSAVVFLLALVALTLWRAESEPEVFNTPAAVTAVLLVTLNLRDLLHAGWAPRALMGLGTISYSLYLTHYPVLRLSLAPAGRLGDIAGTLTVVVAQLAVTLVVAALFWRIVEHPSQMLAKKFTLRRRRVAEDSHSVGRHGIEGG